MEVNWPNCLSAASRRHFTSPQGLTHLGRFSTLSAPKSGPLDGQSWWGNATRNSVRSCSDTEDPVQVAPTPNKDFKLKTDEHTFFGTNDKEDENKCTHGSFSLDLNTQHALCGWPQSSDAVSQPASKKRSGQTMYFSCIWHSFHTHEIFVVLKFFRHVLLFLLSLALTWSLTAYGIIVTHFVSATVLITCASLHLKILRCETDTFDPLMLNVVVSSAKPHVVWRLLWKLYTVKGFQGDYEKRFQMLSHVYHKYLP